jgi:hypothetical protein
MNYKNIPYCLLFVVTIMGCKKETTTRVNTTSNANTQSIIASDELTLNNELDQAVDDAIAVLSNHNAAIAGAISDSISPAAYEINYFGNESNNTKSRSASDSIHLNTTLWVTAGATATITFGDVNNKAYEVLFKTNNTSITLTGKATITNVSGGLLQGLSPTDSMVVHIKASVSYTYNDNATIVQLYTWNFNQLRTFKKPDTTINAITWGDTAIKKFTNVESWGLNRYGDSAYCTITSTIVQNITNLNLAYNPLSGAGIIQNITEPILTTYGVNQQGTPISNGIPYGFIITWTNNGGQAQNVIGYYY